MHRIGGTLKEIMAAFLKCIHSSSQHILLRPLCLLSMPLNAMSTAGPNSNTPNLVSHYRRHRRFSDSFPPFYRGEKRGGSGDDAWLFGPEGAGAGSNSELNSRRKLPGIRKSDFTQRRRASSVGATPGE